MRKLSLAGFLLAAVVFNNSFARSEFSDHNKLSGYSEGYKFNPFFKTKGCKNCENLPLTPELNEFDKAILKVCDNWGNIPENSSFMSVLNDTRLCGQNLARQEKSGSSPN